MIYPQPQKNLFLIALGVFLVIGACVFLLSKGNKDSINSTDLYTNSPEINDKIQSLAEETFRRDLDIAINEPKWKTLATRFKETCDSGSVGSATFGDSRTFKELVQSVETVRGNLDGENILIVPCGQGAYDSSYMIALYDCKTYEPLQIPSVSEDGKIYYYYSATEIEYNPKTNIFSTSASFNGMRTCGESAEYKLVDKELVLQKFAVDRDCQDDEYNEKVVFDINQATSKIDYPPSGDIVFERMVRVNDEVFNVYITSTPSLSPESSYCGGGFERYIHIFNEQKNKQLFSKNIDSCLNDIYLSDSSPDRMFQGNSIVFRWDVIDKKYNVKGVIDLSTDTPNYSETNIIVGKESTISNTLKSERTFIFENFAYDFLTDSCEIKSSPVGITYHDKARKKLFVYFDCSHGATGNTSDAVYVIDLNSHRAEEITQNYHGYSNNNVGVSPNNKYLTLRAVGNSGGCGMYSVIGLVDLEKSTVLEISPSSGDYSYLSSDTVVVSVTNSLPEDETLMWDKEDNLSFMREVYGCSSATNEFDGGFYKIFTEKWIYYPKDNSYKLIQKIKN